MNTVNSGSIDQLNPEEVLLVQIIKNEEDSNVHLELAKLQKVWLSVEPEAGELFGLNFGEDGGWVEQNGKQVIPLNVLNPVINVDGVENYIKIIDDSSPRREVKYTDPPQEKFSASFEYANIGDLLNKNHSDKNSIHRYGIGYDLIFANQLLKQNRGLKLLEIGVFKGSSIHAFSQLPYVNRCVGIDSGDSNVSLDFVFDVEKVKIYLGPEYDAYTEDALNMLLENEGKFDIIIDDGPHTWESQEWFFRNYTKLLNDNGVLVCEDIFEHYYDNLMSLKEELDLYVLDLRMNTNPHQNEFLALKYNR